MGRGADHSCQEPVHPGSKAMWLSFLYPAHQILRFSLSSIVQLSKHSRDPKMLTAGRHHETHADEHHLSSGRKAVPKS